MSVLAESNIWDDTILDEWELPFGDWVKQMVDWIDNNLDWLLSAIEWPFAFLLRNFVDGFLVELPWMVIVAAFFVIGTLVRNLKVGAGSALALIVCGYLGNAYWLETVRTIGMILVAVALCALIGIPLGVLCGRVDGVWNAVRPVLDAMQVVHAFVYMLPVIFFFGIGVEPGTMVTMVFALPPLIRLTNLGVRQVPEDVVEAARAYGAPEWRVLADVQLPLARPAIMAGLNQTLLLAISMIGIAAIMDAGGLGLLVFRAVLNLDTALAASAGLSLFIVAVVLDRISQPEAGDDTNLFGRIRRAWSHRRDPGALLDDAADDGDEATASVEGSFIRLTGSERSGAIGAAVGAALCIVAMVLPWGRDAGLLGGHARRADLDLAGQSFNGLAASGGSWFGILALLASAFVALSAIKAILRPAVGSRWLAADGALIGAITSLALVVAYLVASPALGTAAYSDGVGVYVALLGAAVAVGGAAVWVAGAPFASRVPLADGVSVGRIVTALFGLTLLVVAGFSGWTFDRRADSVISPELAAEIAELRAEAAENPARATVLASRITNLTSQARRTGVIVNDGLGAEGAGLARWTIALGVLGALLALPAAGAGGAREHRRWAFSAAVGGIGLGVTAVGLAWAISITRVAEGDIVSGAGTLLTLIGGFLVFASSRALLALFGRGKVYDDDDLTVMGTDAPSVEPGPSVLDAELDVSKVGAGR